MFFRKKKPVPYFSDMRYVRVADRDRPPASQGPSTNVTESRCEHEGRSTNHAAKYAGGDVEGQPSAC